MIFAIEVKTDGASFEVPEEEIRRILVRLATDERVSPGEAGALLDSNGNTVGGWRWA